MTPLHHPDEPRSNPVRDGLVRIEPRALRTFTPTQAVLARSAGAFHWTPEGHAVVTQRLKRLLATAGIGNPNQSK